MAIRRVVVDGSNIATEGRSVPSLSQLDEAVREFQREFPDAEITVVVDASFGHRIDGSDRQAFEEAEAHGEIVSPPAGAIGRGDAFLLRIAEKTGATVLSNDSFQEFHGEHDWLFSESRLIGGKPVPGVGWIFTPRTPVRGPRSRVAVKDSSRSRVRIGSKEASQPMPVPSAPPPGRARKGRAPGKTAETAVLKEATPATDSKVRQAIAAATKEVVAPQTASAGRKRRRRGSGPPPQAVNDPLTFITFIADHHLGEEVEGEVAGFTSHGAFVRIGDAQAYVPVSGLGDPPPASARRVLRRGERRTFVVQALDPQRRGVELALPDFAHVTGSPSEETVEAEISEVSGAEEPVPQKAPSRKAKAARKAKKAEEPAKKTKPPARKGKAAAKAGKRTAPGKKAATAKTAAPAEKAAPAKKASPAKKAAPAKKASAPPKKAGTKKSAQATKTPAKKASAKKSPAKKTPAKTPARRPPATRRA